MEQGNVNNTFEPEMLISLTLPKECARYFKGKYHVIGGRFVPDSLVRKYQLEMPLYREVEQMCIPYLSMSRVTLVTWSSEDKFICH